MAYRGPVRFLIAWAAPLLVLAVIGSFAGLVLRSGPLSGSDADWPEYSSLDRLLEDSDRVVIARLTAERVVTTELPSATRPSVSAFRTELIRTYEILESLKGDGARGELIDVYSTTGLTLPGQGQRGVSTSRWEATEAEQGRRYVLFVKGHEQDDGTIEWAATGEPGFAEVEGDELRFITTQRYRNDHPGELPFEVTLSELSASISADP